MKNTKYFIILFLAFISVQSALSSADATTQNENIDIKQNQELFQNSTETESAEQKQVALITFSVGRNRIIRTNGAFEQCVIDATLFEGDKISVSSKGKVTIVYKNSGLYKTVNADEELVITARDETKEQEIDAAKVSQAMLENIRGSDDKPILAAVAGTREHRDPNQPFPLSPRNTHILFTDIITFTWQNPDNLASSEGSKIKYRIYILNKGAVILSFECENNTFELDMKKYDMKYDELYYWFVERTDMPRIATVKPMFTVINSDDSAKITKILEENNKLTSDVTDGAPYFLNAKFLVQKLYYQLAIENFIHCYKLSPGDEGLIAAIKETYKLMGFYEAEATLFVNKLNEKYPPSPE